MILRRMVAGMAVLGCVVVLAGSATAAGEEIVIETSPLSPSSPTQWIDYSVAQTQAAWLLNANTCLKLLDYDEDTGVLEPEAAAAMPTVSTDGLTYTFTVRPGQPFSGPGPAETVSAESFRRAIERATSPAMAASISATPPARTFVAGIAGSADFYAGTGPFSGIQASGNTLTIQLSAPDGSFVHRLAMPYFCATRADAPAGYTGTVPHSGGPYFVHSFTATGTPPNQQHEIVLMRNFAYTGSRIQNLGTIRFVQQGSSLDEDYVAAAPASYTPPAGVQIAPTITTTIQLIALNTSRPTFSSVTNRRAASYALNRVALSGVLGWQPTDQFVSPLVPGFEDADVYPLTGNPSTAGTLRAGATPAVTFCHDPARAGVAALAETQLEAVGFQVTRVDPTQLPVPVNYFTYIGNPANCDLAVAAFLPAYPDPSPLLRALFYGGSPSNFSFYSDPGFNDRFDAAPAITPESARLHEYALLDAQLADQAAAIAIGYNLRRDAFADRIGCRVVNQALVGYAVNRLCISVSQPATPGGDPVSTGDDATLAAPLQTSVAVTGDGVGGTVTITQGQSTAVAPPEYRLLEQRLDISAPTQIPPSFLTFTFELDASLLVGPPALTEDDLVPYRNGVPVPDCTGAGATPDPCVASRDTVAGDVVLVVHSTAASIWEFGERYDGTGAVAALQALAAQPGKVGEKAEDALAKLNAALAKLAQTPPDRKGAVGELEGAAGELEAMVKQRLLTPAQAEPLLVEIAGLARQLALQARQDAIDRGGSASKISDATRALDQGDARWAANRFKDAVARYKDAVSKAEGA